MSNQEEEQDMTMPIMTQEEEDELIETSDEEDESDMEDDSDFQDLLAQLLVSEEGQTVGSSLATICKHMEVQNKLLVKLITQLKN
jgi:hypothetical protein